MENIEKKIESYWNDKEKINFSFNNEVKNDVKEVLSHLDSGSIRVCEKIQDSWKVNQWIKKAILLSFKINDNSIFTSGISNSRGGQYTWYDKVGLKTSSWVEDEWTSTGSLQLRLFCLPRALGKCSVSCQLGLHAGDLGLVSNRTRQKV